MNLAQIVEPNGRIDAEAGWWFWGPQLADIPQITQPHVTVREWSAARQRHEELYSGPMRFAHICTLSADRNGVAFG